MALARGVGLDLCPRPKELSDRHLFLPRGSEIPENLKAICHATLDPAKAAKQWDAMVHLFASVHGGHSSAITVLARYGSAARGDRLYEAMVQVGKLLRTVFLCDYFVNEAFRRELLRVPNRGEAVNALKRAIYLGRVASSQAKQHEEMQAVADALSLLANLVMAWNTMKMQSGPSYYRHFWHQNHALLEPNWVFRTPRNGISAGNRTVIVFSQLPPSAAISPTIS
jgi:TnpA family transposase